MLVPVAVSLDAYDPDRERPGDLFEFAPAVAWVEGFRQGIRLDLRPSVETDLGPIPYPSSIRIRREAGASTD